jgi:hypothetical protein
MMGLTLKVTETPNGGFRGSSIGDRVSLAASHRAAEWSPFCHPTFHFATVAIENLTERRNVCTNIHHY